MLGLCYLASHWHVLAAVSAKVMSTILFFALALWLLPKEFFSVFVVKLHVFVVHDQPLHQELGLIPKSIHVIFL